MAFKMKKPSTTQGTVKHTEELQDKYYQALRVRRELDKNMPDGRSMSSPFQHKAYGQPHPINPQGNEQPVGAGHPATAKAHNVKTPTKMAGMAAGMMGGGGAAAGGAAGGGGMMSKSGGMMGGMGGDGGGGSKEEGGGMWSAKDR